MMFQKENMEKFSDSVVNVLRRKVRCQKPDCPNINKYGPSPDLPINEAKSCPNAKISRACAGYGR